MSRYVDLHTHSSASDGTDTPTALVEYAAKAGLAAVALTDHDTVSGLDEATDAATYRNITVIRGCELAASSPYGEIHLVGLWLPNSLPVLGPALERLRHHRDSRNKVMVDKLREHGFAINYSDVEALAKGESVGRLHIARALVEKHIVGSTQEVFATLIGDGKPMHVPRLIPEPAEALRLLRAEGASVIFAHPMLLDAPAEWLDDCVADLSARGLDAIEAYHAEHNQSSVRSAVGLAAKHGLALSGGSDYHGQARAGVRLGAGACGMRLPWYLVEELQKRRERQGLPLMAG